MSTIDNPSNLISRLTDTVNNISGTMNNFSGISGAPDTVGGILKRTDKENGISDKTDATILSATVGVQGNEIATELSSTQCRICHETASECEEGLKSTVCLCAGPLSLCHQTCLQRWVHEQHSTRCEICHRPYFGLCSS